MPLEEEAAVTKVQEDEEVTADMAKSKESEGQTGSEDLSADELTEAIIVPDINSVAFENMAMEQIDIAENSKQVADLSDPIVDGSWKAAQHQNFTGNAAMKAGAIYFDSSASGVAGMTSYPIFHGYSWDKGSSTTLSTGTHNYMAGYKYLTKVALAYKNGSTYKSVEKADVPGIGSDYALLRNEVEHIVGSWKYTTASDKHSFLMGCAMHIATDAIAHSSFEKNGSAWVRLQHPEADTPSGKRWTFAKAIIDTIVERKNGNRSGINYCHDFHPTGFTYSGLDFRTANFKTFASDAGVTNTAVLNDYGKIQNP